MIRRASASDLGLITTLMNTSLAVDGKQLQPLPLAEAREVVSGILYQVPAAADLDDYFIGETPDGSFYTTLLGVINSALAFMIPGVMIGPAPEGGIAFFVDDERFWETTQKMRDTRGFVVDIQT